MSTRAASGAGAVRADAAAVQFDQAPHQRQADAQAALRAVDRDGALHEHVEHVRQQFGRNAHAGIAHAQHHVLAFVPQADIDVAAAGRVLEGVVEQVGDDLLQPGRIAVHPARAEVDRDAVARGAAGGAEGLQAGAHQVGQVGRLARQQDLARHGA